MAKRAGAKSGLATEALYHYAVRALARRPHTFAELRAKLARRCRVENDVDEILGRLEEYEYLSDERVAESYAEFRRDYALLGHRRVLADLRRRGVAEGTAERAVADAYEDADEVELARRFLRRKLGKRTANIRIEDRRTLVRLYNALARAGFGATAILGALGELSASEAVTEALENCAAYE